MKKLFLFLFISSSLWFISCDIDQTQEGELPDVDVDVSADAGKLPAFDVDWADVKVGTRTKTVKVPKVVVVMEETEVEVPYVDVDMPNDEEKEERTLIVEAEVRDKVYDLEIEQVYAVDDRLYVISSLEATDEDIDDQTMRVSDRVIVNVPDFNVKHFIIGKRPEGDFNNQYTFVSSRDELNEKLKNGKAIYTKSMESSN